MSVSDRFLVGFVILWLLLTLAFFLANLPIWGWLWIVILLSVVVAEIVSKVRTRRTITQRFQAFALAHRGPAVLILVGMAVVWTFLLLHLVL